MTANLLIDLDGTVCDDIPNEESHRYATAKPYDGAADRLRELQAEGHVLTYFTAREEKDRNVTIKWLKEHGFPEARLIMDKPRGGRYIWIDNHKGRYLRFRESVHKWNKTFVTYVKKVIQETINYG